MGANVGPTTEGRRRPLPSFGGRVAALASWLVWHMLLTKFPQKTVATAPSSSQLKGALLPEVKMWGKMMPPILLDQIGRAHV